MRWARVVTWIIALGIGAVYGVAGTIAHAYVIGWFPLGVVVGLVGAVALLVAVRALTADRWATLATGAGLIASILLFSGRGPGGSVIVPEGKLDMLGWLNLGQTWMIGVPVAVAIVVLWPDPRPAREP